ncbi:phosphotriesterase [Thermodesulfobacteriota bacterium]
MAIINSVLGPLDTANLGFTLTHEHLLVAAPGIYENYPELIGSKLKEQVVDGLKKAKEGGIDTIVDTTTLDLGRNIELMAYASKESGVNIIACAGWWLDIPRFFLGVSANQLAEVFTREIEEGISGTKIKAGLLKAASDLMGVTKKDEIMLRAVARAHRRTGVPIMLHSYAPGQVARQQLSILKEEGVAPRRVKVDHSNDTTDIEFLTWLLEQGCFLGLDRYPGRNVSPLSRTRTLKALIDAGWSDRLCLSHDALLLRIIRTEEGLLPTHEEAVKINPHGFLYIKNVVFPQLREMGISETTINNLCLVGPRKFFEGE